MRRSEHSERNMPIARDDNSIVESCATGKTLPNSVHGVTAVAFVSGVMQLTGGMSGHYVDKPTMECR